MDNIAHRVSRMERDRIVSILSNALNTDDRVIFAYLYGSFIYESFFNDIDVFVFVKEDNDSFACSVGLMENLFDAITKAGVATNLAIDDLDVRVINDSPYDFVIDLLDEGMLIVDKNPELRTDYIEEISDRYRVNYFVLDEAYGEDR